LEFYGWGLGWMELMNVGNEANSVFIFFYITFHFIFVGIGKNLMEL